jgi:peroxiredoxin
MKKTILLSLFLAFATLVFADGTGTKVETGQSVPEFKFHDQNGKKVSISDFKGKVVMINFFATWCPPCRKELPEVQKQIWDKYKDNPNFVMLVFGREQTADELNKFKKENHYTFPIIPDVKRKIFSLFAEQSIPRNFVIGPDGKIIFESIGYTPKDFQNLMDVLARNVQ